MTDLAARSNTFFDWSEQQPRPAAGAMVGRDQMQQLYHAALSLPYQGQWDAQEQEFIIEPHFQGLTNVEVMVMRQIQEAALGNMKTIETIMDRTLGKPKQSVEAVVTTVSLAEYLDYLADLEEQEQNLIDIIPDERPEDVLLGL